MCLVGYLQGWSEVQKFRAEVREWLDDNLIGEFAELKGLGGPGREHEAFEERLAWNRHLAEAGWTCLGWPKEHGGRGLSVAHASSSTRSTPAPTRRPGSTTSARNCSGRR